jgi:hypothetical protein
LGLPRGSGSEIIGLIPLFLFPLLRSLFIDEDQTLESSDSEPPEPEAQERTAGVGETVHFIKKICAVRESNPKLNLGRVSCYHYTNGAWRNTREN